ncbi:MAG: hypothetical protein R3E95_07695 [Thiolinea sp.]
MNRLWLLLLVLLFSGAVPAADSGRTLRVGLGDPPDNMNVLDSELTVAARVQLQLFLPAQDPAGILPGVC